MRATLVRTTGLPSNPSLQGAAETEVLKSGVATV